MEPSRIRHSVRLRVLVGSDTHQECHSLHEPVCAHDALETNLLARAGAAAREKGADDPTLPQLGLLLRSED